MEEISSLLLSLKEKGLNAVQTGDEDFFRTYLAENSINVIQSGIFNKEGFIKKLSSGYSLQLSSADEETQVFILNNGNGVVTFKACIKNSDEREFSPDFLITTIYSCVNGCWQIIFYQQTPIS
ncbi:MAG TPA: hypothetical protein VMT35_15505 [Ignavibacteriaceae bacterium]|nr:hypothetical protein [Ignavibacteriaceae bacterium]